MKHQVRVWSRPEPNKPARVTTGDGGTYLIDLKDTWHRERSVAGQVRDRIMAELRRCGWRTHKVQVTYLEGKPLPPKDGKPGGVPFAIFARIGALRGLDGDQVYKILRALPNNCGVKAILAKIGKLPEQVERLATENIFAGAGSQADT